MSERRGQHVIFGRPWRQALPEALEHLGITRAAILCSPGRAGAAAEIGAALGDRGGEVLALARRHVPREIVSEAARRLDDLGAGAVIAIGGGSAIGLGKALRLERELAFVAVPTTYSGSEVTDIYGIRDGSAKQVGRDPRVRPDAVVYDPALTLELSPQVTAASLMNALAHAVDSLYATGLAPEVAQRAEGAIAELSTALAALVRDPRDLAARDQAQRGAHEAGRILDGAGMALHHKLAHVVAGSRDLPHAETHAALLAHVVAFNAGAAPAANERIARALGADDPAAAIFDLAGRAGLELSLEVLGLDEEAARAAAATTAAADPDNPRRGTAAELEALLADARAGRRPGA